MGGIINLKSILWFPEISSDPNAYGSQAAQNRILWLRTSFSKSSRISGKILDLSKCWAVAMHESHESDDSNSWWILVTHEVWAWRNVCLFLPMRQRTNHVETYRSRYNDKNMMIDTWSRICLWWKLIKKSSPIHPFDSTLGKTHCRAKRTCTIVTWKETGRRWMRILVKAWN